MNALKKIFQTLFRKKNDRRKLDHSDVEEIFSELEEIQSKKQRIRHYIEELKLKEEAHKQYENLDPDIVAKINGLAQKAKSIEEKKQNLRGRLISNNAALNRLADYEDEIPDLIKEMQMTEKRRRETESHILYLNEERISLEEERAALINGYSFLKGLSLVLVVLIGVSVLVSFVMLQVLREKIWFILSAIVVLMVFFVIAIILIKEKLEKEIKDNGILQQKAVRYLNKSKIRFFNHTQYLEFQYRKLGVDSVAKLELYYNRYLKNKNNERIYLQMNDALAEIEEEILGILHSKNILLEDLGDLSGWILKPKCFNEIKQIVEEKEKIEEQFNALCTYEAEIWQELSVLATDEALKAQIDSCLEGFNGENMLDKISASA